MILYYKLRVFFIIYFQYKLYIPTYLIEKIFFINIFNVINVYEVSMNLNNEKIEICQPVPTPKNNIGIISKLHFFFFLIIYFI